MEPTQELIDQLRRDKIEAARRMSPERKLAAGVELFSLARSVAFAGIRMQHPDADAAELRRLFRSRLWFWEKRGRV